MLKAFSIEYRPLGTKYHKNVSLNLVIPIFRRNFANANGKNAAMLLASSKESGCSSVG